MTCIKCGGDAIHMSYHRGARYCLWGSHADGSGEHLHYTCRTCQYDWSCPTLDSDSTTQRPAKEE